MKALFKWLNRLFAASQNGPAPTLPSSSSPSKTSSIPAPITPEKPRIAKLVEIAERELGKKETRNNVGPAVRRYQAATNLDPGAWPWCAAFCAWILEQWLADPENVQWLALKSTTPSKWRPKTALAYGFIRWAEARPATCTILPDTAEAQPGDFVCYDFSHIGIVKRSLGGEIEAIEGNTNGAGSRDGDGVYLKTRPRKLARCFIRIRPSGVQNAQ
jgi:hypothetical protein